jgi:hypothetical protein
MQILFAGKTAIAVGGSVSIITLVSGNKGMVVYRPGSELPPGVVMTVGGMITGRATVAGTYRLVVIGTDASGATASATVTIVVG